jgi:hypothetical protein
MRFGLDIIDSENVTQRLIDLFERISVLAGIHRYSYDPSRRRCREVRHHDEHEARKLMVKKLRAFITLVTQRVYCSCFARIETRC